MGPRTALRAIVEALGTLGDGSSVRPLLRIAMTQSECDPILSQAARLAIRDLMQSQDNQHVVLDIGRVIRGFFPQTGIDIASKEAEYLMPILIALQSKMPFDAMSSWLEVASQQDADLKKATGRLEQYLPAMAGRSPPERSSYSSPNCASSMQNNPVSSQSSCYR